jgi:hypothetical protein
MYRLPLYLDRRKTFRNGVHNLPSSSPTHASNLHSMKPHETPSLSQHITDRLAAELYDRILDHIHTVSTLTTCSLVCKSWLPSSRYHLFHEFNITPDFVKSMRSSLHAMETVAPYIRNVGLCGAWMAEEQYDFDSVMSFLLELDNVQGLYMETWSWDVLNSATSDFLIKAKGNFFHKIKKLHLKYAHFPSLSLLVQFICAFPMMEDLSLDNVTWDHELHPLSSSLPPLLVNDTTVKVRERDVHPIHLTTLYVRSCPVKPILSWLFNGAWDELIGPIQDQPIPPIRILSLPEILSDETNMVAAILTALGPSLQHVELGFMARRLVLF